MDAQESTSLSLLNPEVALENHPKLLELRNKQAQYVSTFRELENLLSKIENALLVIMGGGNTEELVRLIEKLVGQIEIFNTVSFEFLRIF